MAFHQNKTAGAARLAVAYGVSRVRYMVGSFAAETIMLQGWYMVLYFLLSVVTGSLSQPGRTAFFWMQSAGFCRQAMRWFGWYADFAAVNWRGLLSALW